MIIQADNLTKEYIINEPGQGINAFLFQATKYPLHNIPGLLLHCSLGMPLPLLQDQFKFYGMFRQHFLTLGFLCIYEV